MMLWGQPPRTIVIGPVLDSYLLATKYGLMMFGCFGDKFADPIKQIKEAYLCPWNGVVAWELVDVDKPRRIALLGDFISHAKVQISLFKKAPFISCLSCWLLILENPFERKSRAFEDILSHLRAKAGDRELKGLEKHGTYVLVKEKLKECEVLAVEKKDLDELLLGKKGFSCEDLLKAILFGHGFRITKSTMVDDGRFLVAKFNTKEVLEKLGYEGFYIYFTDKGIAGIHEGPELDLPMMRIEYEIDVNDPFLRKLASVVGVKPSKLRHYNFYRLLRCLNFRARSIFWGPVGEDDTTPLTLRATRAVMEKVKKGELDWVDHIEPLGDQFAKIDERQYSVLRTYFWDPAWAPFKVSFHICGTYRDEEGLERGFVDVLRYGEVMSIRYEKPLRGPEDFWRRKPKRKDYLRMYELALDEETRAIMDQIGRNQVPEPIADKIHEEYERITQEGPEVFRRLRRMWPKCIPFLFYIY